MKHLLLLLALVLALPAASRAQAPTPVPVERPDPDEMLRRRVEALSRSGRADEAIALLEQRRASGDFGASLGRRLVRLYQEAGRYEDVETLLLEMTPDESEMDFGDLRQLAEARHALGRTAEAERALERALALDRTDLSRIAVLSNLHAQWGDLDRAIEILLQAREELDAPLEFAQTLARHYVSRGDGVEAMRETMRVVAAGPLNLAIMRGQVVQLAEEYADQGDDLLDAARSVQEAHPDVPQLKILVAEIAVTLGQEDLAWSELRPLTAHRALGQDLLRIAIAGLADSRLPDADPDRAIARLRLSVRISRGLLGNETLPGSLEPRAYDTLVRSLLGVLDSEGFARLDLAERELWLDESRLAVLEMNERYPGNSMAAAATLRLAEVYTDALGDPQKAIELFDAIARSSSASAEDVLSARLGLARAYVVAGDTLQARADFERLGRDSTQPQGQNRAQYHLGLLDFMGGEFDEAEDRLKAVALRAPRETYTNDALDLAILIAEEKFGGAPDQDGLRQYGVMLYQRATHQTEAMVASLETLAERPASAVRDRSRLALATLYRDRRDFERALSWVDRVVEESPRSRTVAEALDLRAAVLVELGRPGQASEALERILLEHEDYVMIDRVRDRLAELRGDERVRPEGEVP